MSVALISACEDSVFWKYVLFKEKVSRNITSDILMVFLQINVAHYSVTV